MLKKLISILAILSLIFTMAIIPVNAETASLEQLKATFDEAKAEYEAALTKIVFSEDFEGTTNKLGVFNPKGSMKNFTEALVTDNGNTYEKVTVSGGSWYGSNTGDGTVVSLFKTAEKTDYVVRFKINQTIAMKSNHFYTVGNKALAGGYNAVNPSAFSVDSTTKSTNNTFCSLNANIGNTANLNKWHDIEVTFNTGDYTYAGFYINLGLADGTSSADVLIDDIMVIPAADLATFDSAKANYEAAETAYLDALKAQTKSDFNSAMTDFSAKEAAYNSALNKVVFAEDYEDTANVKMDSISGSAGTSNFTTNYVTENGNTYAKVTSTGTTWYGIRTSSSTYTALNLALNTEYIITFKYKTEGESTDRFLIKQATGATGGANNTTIIPNSYVYGGTIASSAGTANGSNLDLINADMGWVDVEIRFTNTDATKPYVYFYLNTGANGINKLDDITLMTADDYDALKTAEAEYKTAEHNMADAYKAYNAVAGNTKEDSAVFSENYKDTANVKMDSISGSAGTSNFTTNYVTENGNTYAKVTSTGTTWYGIRTSSSTYTALNLALNTEYILTFKYKTDGKSTDRFLIKQATGATGGANNTTIIPNSYVYGGTIASSAGTTNGSNLDLINADMGWVDVEIRFTNTDATKPYVYFYTNTYSLTATTSDNCYDDFCLMTVADYEAYNAYKKAESIAANHNEGEMNFIDASIDKNGAETLVCTCGQVISSKVVFALANVNGDGAIDVRDLIRAKKAAAQIEVKLFSDLAAIAGDKATINADDVNAIRTYLLSK